MLRAGRVATRVSWLGRGRRLLVELASRGRVRAVRITAQVLGGNSLSRARAALLVHQHHLATEGLGSVSAARALGNVALVPLDRPAAAVFGDAAKKERGVAGGARIGEALPLGHQHPLGDGAAPSVTRGVPQGGELLERTAAE